jgi:putative flippase GtrA
MQIAAPEWALATWGFVLNGVWEFAQSPLYADWHNSIPYLIRTRLHCTAGDVFILLVAFWVTSLLLRTRRWIAESHVGGAMCFVSIGFLVTIWSEWSATGVRAAWQYSPAMPLLFGIGVAPLLQWLVVPPVVLLLTRTLTEHRAGAGQRKGRQSPPGSRDAEPI